MNEEIQKTLDHCVEYATDLLVETGESYPFGAFIDTIGNVHPLEMEIDKKNVPTIGKVIEALSKYCEEEMSANKIRAYALTYEVALQFEDKGDQQDCIAIDIKHVEDTAPLFYLPFTKEEDGKSTPGDLFAVQRN